MDRNVGRVDQIVRFILGGAFIGFGIPFGPVGIIVGIVLAAVMWVTAYTGVCPLYRLLHVSTYRHSGTAAK